MQKLALNILASDLIYETNTPYMVISLRMHTSKQNG